MIHLPKILTHSLRPFLRLQPANLVTKPSFSFAESSKDMENRMRMQRHKSINNEFKALQTHFGLKKPKEISSGYAKPSRIEFTIESLRKYSHTNPEFLLKQLNNPKSQFYETMQKALRGFEAVDNKQAIQFLNFLVAWDIYLQDELYCQVIIRKIYQMELNLEQLFEILQFVIEIKEDNTKKKVMSYIQQKILRHILNIDVKQYSSLFKIINFMRVHDLSPKLKPETVQELNQKPKQRQEQKEKEQEGEKEVKEEKGVKEDKEDKEDKEVKEEEQEQEEVKYDQDSFFKVVESVLLRDLKNIPLPNLVEMVVHYANNIKEDYDDMINILTKTETKIIENIRFFNHDELIAIMFSYIKTGTASQKLIDQFVNRVELLYFEITWDNKKRILQLASSLPHNKWVYIVGISIFEVLKGKKVIYRDGIKEVDPSAKEVEYQLLPTIYQAASETNLATPQLIEKLQDKMLENIFNYSSQDLGQIAWLFTITPTSLAPAKKSNKNTLYQKLESVIQGGFNGSTFTLKDISMVVWALCNTGGKSNQIYKQTADFWKNIEFYIQERIGNKKEERLFNSCCQVLWAFGNNKPLTIKTVNLILDVIVEKESQGSLQEEMFVFQLTTITSFFNSIKDYLPGSINKYMETLSIKYFTELVREMNYYEIMKILKYIIYDQEYKVKPNKLPETVWNQVLDQFVRDLDQIEYGSIMGVISFTLASPQGLKKDPKAVQLVEKLMERKKKLQQLKTTPQSQQ